MKSEFRIHLIFFFQTPLISGFDYSKKKVLTQEKPCSKLYIYASSKLMTAL